VRKIALLYTLSLLFFSAFYTLLHVEISTCKVDNTPIQLPFIHAYQGKKLYNYECTLTANITKNRLIGIQVDDSIEAIFVNDKNIDLSYHKEKYSQEKLNNYKVGYRFNLPLLKGENTLHVQGYNKGGGYSFNVQPSLGVIEYMMLFFLVIIPFIYASIRLFFTLLEKDILTIPSKKWLYYLPFAIIVVGMLLRINLLVNTNNSLYQHDLDGHREMVIYYANNGVDVPQADKTLQAPQQVLYYLIAAPIYNISKALNFKEHEAFFTIRSLSVGYALGVLVFGYLLIQLFTRKRLYISLFMAFLSFTPYFVFMGAQINNDALNALLGMMALYFILSYYKHPTLNKFSALMLIIPLAILTKISSLLFALTLLVVLFLHYFYYASKTSSLFSKSLIEKRVLILSILTMFVFSLALLKSYIPILGEFRFVNSYLFSNQVIPALDLGYFFSFHYFDLISEGQAYVFGENSIRFSFLTFQYGSMLTGEYGYDKFFASGSFFKLMTQGIYIFGIIYVIGFIAYILSFNKQTPLAKLLLFPVIINMLLIIKFLSDYWNVCNSDFRYYSPVIGAIGLIFVLGIKAILERHKGLEKSFIVVATLFYTLQITWSLYIVHVS